MKKKVGVRDSSSSKDIKSSTKLDSSTKDYKRLEGTRKVVSIRVKHELKEAVMSFCKENGLSLCHVTEGLWTGLLYGLGLKIKLVNKSPTINLTVVREVKRARRYAVEFDNDRYCALKDRYFRLDDLPNPYCLKCPNKACRSSILKIEEGIINK